MKRCEYYVAYGSNLNVEQMGLRCPKSKAVGTAFIEGYELLFKGSHTGSYLTIEPKVGGCVPVAVWAVTGADIQSLDSYEGYPIFYYKKPLTLSVRALHGGRKSRMDAFVYIMHEDRHLGLPSERYVDTCLEGYRYFGFDESFIYDAIKRSMEVA